MEKRALRHINLKGGGFTLVELMVTVAILVILLAIGAPQLQTFVAKRSVSTQAEILASALRMARSEAIKRSLSVAVCASNNPNGAGKACSATNNRTWSTGWLVFVDTANDGAYDDTKLVSLQQAFTNTGKITYNANGPITFSNNGLTRQIGTFTVEPVPTNAALNMCVVVASSGRVKINKAPTTGVCP